MGPEVMKYNGHNELKATGTGGAFIMAKGRKTTFDERVEIVEYCNYAETAEKHRVSYQQVYSWIGFLGSFCFLIVQISV